MQCSHHKAPWTATAHRGYRIVALILMMLLASCGNSTSQNEEASTEQERSIHDLYIYEASFEQLQTELLYSFIIDNPHPSALVRDASYQIAVYDDRNALLETQVITVPMHLPDQFLGVVDNLSLDQGETAARIEIIPRPGTFIAEPDNLPYLSVANPRLQLDDDRRPQATGTIENLYDEQVFNIQVFAIAYDEDNTIVGGGRTVISQIPAGGMASVEIDLVTSSAPLGGVVLYPTFEVHTLIDSPPMATSLIWDLPPSTVSSSGASTASRLPRPHETREAAQVGFDSEEAPGEADDTPDTTPDQPVNSSSDSRDESVEEPPEEGELFEESLPEEESGDDLAVDEGIVEVDEGGNDLTADEGIVEEFENIEEEDDTNTSSDAEEENDTATKSPTRTSEPDEPTNTHTNTPEPDEPTNTHTPEPDEPTSTHTPTDTPEPSLEQPTGDCAENAPDGSKLDGPEMWMPHTLEAGEAIISEGDQATICVWMVLDGAPVEGAEVTGVLTFSDFQLNVETSNLDSATTGSDGIATITFTTPKTPAGDVELEVSHDGTTYKYEDAYFLKMKFKNP